MRDISQIPGSSYSNPLQVFLKGMEYIYHSLIPLPLDEKVMKISRGLEIALRIARLVCLFHSLQKGFSLFYIFWRKATRVLSYHGCFQEYPYLKNLFHFPAVKFRHMRSLIGKNLDKVVMLKSGQCSSYRSCASSQLSGQ